VVPVADLGTPIPPDQIVSVKPIPMGEAIDPSTVPSGKPIDKSMIASVRPIAEKYAEPTMSPGQAAESVANKVIGAVAPHSPAQAAIMALQGVLPFAGELAPALEGLSPELAKGLTYIGQRGLGPLATRIGLTGAAGAAGGAIGPEGAKAGAIEGLETGAMGEVPAPLARVASGLKTAETAASGVMRESAADTASQKALENELGVKGLQARELAQPTSVAPSAQQLARGKGTMADVRRQAIHEVGQKYEPIYGPIEKQAVPKDRLSEVASAARGANEWAAAKGARLSPSTQKLLAQLEGLSPADIAASAGGRGKGGGAIPLTNEQIVAINAQLEDITGLGPQTVGKLRGALGQVVAEANRPTSSAFDRRALLDASKPMIEALNDAVPPEQRPLLQQINNEYAQVNRIFPFKDLKKIQSARTLPELGEVVFGKGNEAATSMAVSRMSPEQKDIMRQAFGSWILKDGEAPTVTLSKLAANKDAVAALYRDSAFGKIGAWRDMMIAQKKFQQGPPNLPSQKQFEQGLQDSIKASGLTPEAAQAATDALKSSVKGMPYIVRYGMTWGALGALGGYGALGHNPELVIPIAVYGASHYGLRAILSNPTAAEGYRRFVMSGWTRKGGEAFGRLLVGGVNDALRGSPTPQHQATGAVEAGPGIKALDKYRAEHLAPTASATDRAHAVARSLGRGRTPDVHRDLSSTRLSADEVHRILRHSRGDAASLVSGMPLSEMLDAADVASADERRLLLPLMKQRLGRELPRLKNLTLQASLARRFKTLAWRTSAEG
jgi:hypothetical protein